MEENLLTVGRAIDIIDMKDKDGKKRTLGLQLEHSIIFMGVAVFGNKVYICGGRNVFG